MKKLLLLMLAAGSLAACRSSRTIPVTLPDGFVVQAQVANTPQQQEHGLMFVTDLPEDKGMIFIFDTEQDQLFWMKNTLIDLDMVFIDSTKKVTQVASEVPHSYTYTPDDEVAYAVGYGQYVLELAAKTAQKHQVVPGSTVQFSYESL